MIKHDWATLPFPCSHHVMYVVLPNPSVKVIIKVTHHMISCSATSVYLLNAVTSIMWLHGHTWMTSQLPQVWKLIRILAECEKFISSAWKFPTSLHVRSVRRFSSLLSNKHNAELQRTDPGTKVTGELVPGDIFSHLMFEMNLYHFHRFSWEKVH